VTSFPCPLGDRPLWQGPPPFLGFPQVFPLFGGRAFFRNGLDPSFPSPPRCDEMPSASPPRLFQVRGAPTFFSPSVTSSLMVRQPHGFPEPDEERWSPYRFQCPPHPKPGRARALRSFFFPPGRRLGERSLFFLLPETFFRRVLGRETGLPFGVKVSIFFPLPLCFPGGRLDGDPLEKPEEQAHTWSLANPSAVPEADLPSFLQMRIEKYTFSLPPIVFLLEL